MKAIKRLENIFLKESWKASHKMFKRKPLRKILINGTMIISGKFDVKTQSVVCV